MPIKVVFLSWILLGAGRVEPEGVAYVPGGQIMTTTEEFRNSAYTDIENLSGLVNFAGLF